MTLPSQLAPVSGSDPDDANAGAATGSGANAEPGSASANPPGPNPEQPPVPVAPVSSASGASGSTAGTAAASQTPPAEPEPSVTPPSESSLPSAAEQCSDGVLDAAQSSCYRVATLRATWQAARAECGAWGGALAKVESPEEDQLLAQFVSEDMWLGASDTLFDNVFVWTDGSPIVFGNWGPAQPDRFPGPDCIQKRSSEGRQWFDQPCDNQWLYVCEKAIRR
jgi:hypothetical protein